jgi:hypothetical protein
LEKSKVLIVADVDSGKEKFSIEDLTNLREIARYKDDTYPYAPTVLEYGKSKIILNKPLNCFAETDGEIIILRNDEFDITVWGNSREEAEKEMQEYFIVLYKGYYLNSPSKQSEGAKELGKSLHEIVRSYENI